MSEAAFLLELVTALTVPRYGQCGDARRRDPGLVFLRDGQSRRDEWNGVFQALQGDGAKLIDAEVVGAEMGGRSTPEGTALKEQHDPQVLVFHARAAQAAAELARRRPNVEALIAVAGYMAAADAAAKRNWSIYLELNALRPWRCYTIYRSIVPSGATVARRIVRAGEDRDRSDSNGAACLMSAYPQEVADLIVAASRDRL